jgi:hypothetical protein
MAKRPVKNPKGNDTTIDVMAEKARQEIEEKTAEARARLDAFTDAKRLEGRAAKAPKDGKNGSKPEKKRVRLVLVRKFTGHTCETEPVPLEETVQYNARIRRDEGKPMILLHTTGNGFQPVAPVALPKTLNITPDELYADCNWRDATRWQRDKATRWQQIKVAMMVALVALVLLAIFLIGATVFSET